MLDATRYTHYERMMTRLVSILVVTFLMLSRITVFAGGGEVIVIYNTRMPESKAVADYYASRRNVPTNQLFGFSLSTNSDMTRSEFRDLLQKPLAEQLEERNLWHIRSQFVPATTNRAEHMEWRVKDSKIRYAVLCYGVPFRILRDNQLNEDSSAEMREEFKRNEACVENELALLPMIEQRPPLTGPLGNPFYGTTNAALLHPTNGILLVTRLDGPSAEIARGLVDKAIQAETEGMWGRAYFDLRGTEVPGLKLGDEWIGGAAEICRRLGFETTVDTNAASFPAGFPLSHIAFYCGWYDEHASGPFAATRVEFMPGAFAYHLHSFNAANIRDPSTRWVGPFLAKGVTITMGSVDEPYLPGTPNVSIFAADLIYGRYSFAEAAYASQLWLSWQTTTIGDPLYRPFAKSPDILHTELGLKQSKFIEWSYLRLVNLNEFALKKPLAELVNLLEQIPILKESAVLMEKLADLYAAQGKPASAIATYARALKLNSSREQRIRLRLVLGGRLAAANKNVEAAENYHKLLEEMPDYPGKALIMQKLAALESPTNSISNSTRADTNAPAAL